MIAADDQKSQHRYLTDSDIPEAADLLVRLCKEFVEAAPGMWEKSGLGKDEKATSE